MTVPPADPTHQRAHALLDEGNRLEAAGSIEAAHARYRAACDLAPDLPRAHLNIGDVLARLGDTQGAVAA